MRVAIFGGWDEDTGRNKEWEVAAGKKSQAQIVEACREIGARLARNKHSVIVGSEKKNSADYHVVHAMLDELKAHAKILADYGGHIYIHLKDSSDISTIERELNNRLGKAHSP